jgi:hypothetical protein
MSATNSFEPVVSVTGIDRSAINYEMTPAVSKEQLKKSVSRLVIDASREPVASVSCESGLEGTVGTGTVVSGEDTRSFTLTVTTVSGASINYSYAPRP